MRVLIGPVEIAGAAKGLSKGMSELGVESQIVLSIKHPFAYGGEKKGFLLAIWQWLWQWRAAPQQPIWRKALAVVLHRAWGFLVLCWALFAFDAFIFLYGRTLTDTRLELVVLRRLGKKIIFINVGSDFRPPYMDGVVSPPTDSEPDVSHLAQLAQRAKRKIILHERYANFIVSSPSSAHFHERPFINWFSMGVPASFEFRPLSDTEPRGCLRVVHSPSNPVAKGSEIICEVIQQLIDEGTPLELICLQGVSNDEVLRQLERCDFVVDQLYSDIPMAVLGSEAARFGKPRIVAGYLADEVDAYIPQQDVPPSLYVRPGQLREAIKKMVEDEGFRRGLGLQAREFVSQRWACRAVAERYLMLLNGQVRSDWWFDPANITYVGGFAMPLSHIAHLLARLIGSLGVEVLQVSDKPFLRQALVELAQQMECEVSSD